MFAKAERGTAPRHRTACRSTRGKHMSVDLTIILDHGLTWEELYGLPAVLITNRGGVKLTHHRPMPAVGRPSN